ncbi:MAG: hypothetical protein M3N57_06250 [Actinomycetota bacterium]|nr:hypothetical protein [Actinomycetota bacterium]
MDAAHNGVEPLVLRPARTTAAWWSLLGLALVAAGAALVADSGGHPLSWAGLALFVPVAAFFVAQLVPGMAWVHLDGEGIYARMLWWRTAVTWDHVHLARVRRVAGDPVLVLDVREQGADGAEHRRHTAIVLPVGCDVTALHDLLARRLGRGGRLAAPRTLRPLDL